MKIAVLGAGISGLTSAWHLRRLGHDVTVFEASERLGGNIWTDDVDGCRVEWGPNGFLDNEPTTLELTAALGLDERLQRAREEAAIRWLFRDGRLREIPTKPPSFLLGDCLPLGARLRAMLEPLSRRADGDESVRSFATRHLGRGAADLLVDAMVSGVFAGDPARLSVRDAFPKLYRLEKEHRSLILGAKGRGFGPKGVLTSFDGGLAVLVDALAEDLDVRRGERLDAVPAGFDLVVCTLPAPRAADVLGDADLGAVLRTIPHAPIVVVALVFDEPEAADVPDGFGFLSPRSEGLRILGCLYDSCVFAGRAPEGKRLFRVLIGGRRDPGIVELDDEATMAIVARDLQKAWGRFPAPRSTRIVRHALGIAQYEMGHADRVARAEALCPPDLRLAGASYRGVSLNLCIKDALSWAPEGP